MAAVEQHEDEMPAGLEPGQILIRLAAVAALLTLLVLAVLFLPFLHSVRDRFGDARPVWLVLVAVFQLCSEVSFALALHAVFARRLPRRISLDIAYVEQGANVLLPTGGAGGIAVGAVALGRAGLDASRVAVRSVSLFLLTSGVSVVTMIVAGLGTAVGLFGGDMGWVTSALPALIGVGILLGFYALHLIPNPRPRDGFLGTLVRVSGTLQTGVTESLVLLREADPLLYIGACGYLWWDIASLGAAFAAFGGGGPAFGPFVLAYIVGQLGSLIPIPGGVGGTDGGLIGFMVLYGATGSAAAAAVLAFRVFQLGFPAFFGTIALGRLKGDIEQVAELRRVREAAAEA